jgi:hypothetical protein
MPLPGTSFRLTSWRGVAVAVIVGAGLAVAVTAAGAPRRGDASPDTARAVVVTALGATDGYIFVLNPFNCVLREAEIETMQRLALRHRRSGRVLTMGHDASDSATARRAAVELGVTLPVSPLGASSLANSPLLRSIGTPAVIAVRNGRVIGTLAGVDFERSAEWIRWIEHGADATGRLSDSAHRP